jgi:hypothetical protein
MRKHLQSSNRKNSLNHSQLRALTTWNGNGVECKEEKSVKLPLLNFIVGIEEGEDEGKREREKEKKKNFQKGNKFSLQKGNK